jgi:hypothetical protein
MDPATCRATPSRRPPIVTSPEGDAVQGKRDGLVVRALKAVLVIVARGANVEPSVTG